MKGTAQATVPAPLQVAGFRAAGLHCGIKQDKPDLGLLVCDGPRPRAAAVFTQNAFAAAPVRLGRKAVQDGDVRALIVNSGNANACTGAQGDQDARTMATDTAVALGLDPDQVLVASTGIIGKPLPMEPIQDGIPRAAEAVADDGLEAFAEAIMTTDRTPKHAVRTVQAEGRTFTVAGVAKGVGMIHPDMATMLAFLATDAPVDHTHLHTALKGAVDRSFNQASVDGDESTNDMAALFASGAEGGPTLTPDDPAWEPFQAAVTDACIDLARQMVADGEGAHKRMEVVVEGAATSEDARRAARAVASSTLVKAALHGNDPNWGRVVAAVGSTRIPLDPARVGLTVEADGQVIPVLTAGEPGTDADRGAAAKLLQGTDLTLRITLDNGTASGTAWGCDLTEEYVTFNSQYTT